MDAENFSWLGRKPDTLKYHLNHPDVDPEAYARKRRIEFGQQLMSMRRIYFDTNHWIHWRDVLMERPRTTSHKQIFARLKDLRQKNRVVCPVSYSVYSELMRQSDDATRKATARAIDLLAGGACIQPPDEVFRQEVLYFLQRTTTPGLDLHPVAEMVWTKAAFILGDRFLQVPQLPKDLESALTKAMDDLCWGIGLEELISVLPVGSPAEESASLNQFATDLTLGKKNAAKDSDTFDELFQQEVAGGLEPYNNLLGELMLYVCSTFGFNGQPSIDDKSQAGGALRNLICQAFRFKKVSIELPSIHIHAGLHAALRFEKPRAYKPGDCEDFRHAAAALPYYDTFCTDRSLKLLLCHKLLRYDQAYSTVIVSDDEEIIALVDEVEG